MNDECNMFPQVICAVKEIGPKAFILENVKDLLREYFFNYYQFIIYQLTYPDLQRKTGEKWDEHALRLENEITCGMHSGLKYNVIYQLLNAADYGVPHVRHRVLIVGIRSDFGLQFSFPQATHGQDAFL
jgi:DNA (cytosine-5)-methyltransferase 1